jgi:hypothetical protein
MSLAAASSRASSRHLRHLRRRPTSALYAAGASLVILLGVAASLLWLATRGPLKYDPHAVCRVEGCGEPPTWADDGGGVVGNGDKGLRRVGGGGDGDDGGDAEVSRWCKSAAHGRRCSAPWMYFLVAAALCPGACACVVICAPPPNAFAFMVAPTARAMRNMLARW